MIKQFKRLNLAEMIDYYVKLVGVDHVGIATDDMFSTKGVVDFAIANAKMYDDGGNKMRVYAQVSEGVDPKTFQARYSKRLEMLTKMRHEYMGK